MKAILAALVLVALNTLALAADSYVIIGAPATIKTQDGISLPLFAGDCLPFAGKSDSGAWVTFNVAGIRGSMPWHDTKSVADTPAARTAYKALLKRLAADYRAAASKREAGRAAAREQAIAKEDQAAIAREEMMKLRQLQELQNISEQLEILNRRR